MILTIMTSWNILVMVYYSDMSRGFGIFCKDHPNRHSGVVGAIVAGFENLTLEEVLYLFDQVGKDYKPKESFREVKDMVVNLTVSGNLDVKIWDYDFKKKRTANTTSDLASLLPIAQQMKDITDVPIIEEPFRNLAPPIDHAHSYTNLSDITNPSILEILDKSITLDIRVALWPRGIPIVTHLECCLKSGEITLIEGSQVDCKVAVQRVGNPPSQTPYDLSKYLSERDYLIQLIKLFRAIGSLRDYEALVVNGEYSECIITFRAQGYPTYRFNSHHLRTGSQDRLKDVADSLEKKLMDQYASKLDQAIFNAVTA